MNARQKEVLEQSLKDEQAVLDALTKNYTSALADIRKNIRELQANPLTQSKAYQLEYQKQLEKQISGVLDNLQGKNFNSIASYLQACYETGFVGNMYDMQGQGVPLVIPIDEGQVLKAVQKTGDDFKLSKKLSGNTTELKKQVKSELQRGLASQLSYADIARNISNYGQADMNRSMRIARTEGHRVQSEARLDSMYAAKKKGADIVKQWDATLDGQTRPNHRQLDGQIRELDEPFEVGGMKVDCPGGFGIASEDCNCRCCVLQRARWVLDDAELNTLKERATYYGLDKTKDFKEFKQKYLQVTNQLFDPPVIIEGVDCTVTKGMFGFHDGYGGIKKTINAVTYETPDGTQFIFPENYIKSQQQMTPEQAIRCWYQVPAEIRSKAQKIIEFVDYYNPADSYWRKIYKNFPHSYATGGDEITFYRYDHPHQDDYVIRTYCHEAGHLIDITLSTHGNKFSEENLWTNAMKNDIIASGKKSPTTYGENSCVEDFAESVAEFVKDETGFTRQFPNRAKIIKSIIKKVI